MAAGSISKKPKPKRTQMGRGAVISMNRKAYGDEPEFDRPVSRSEASTAFSWYTVNCDRKQARGFLVDHLEAAGRTSDLELVRRTSDTRVRGYVATGCWVARMLSNGVEFEDPEWARSILDDGLSRLARKLAGGESEVEGDDDSVTVPTAYVRPKFDRLTYPRNPGFRTPQERRLDSAFSVLNAAADALDLTDTGRLDARFSMAKAARDAALGPEHSEMVLRELEELAAEVEECLQPGSEFRERWPERVNPMKKRRPLVASMLFDLNGHIDDLKRKRARTDPTAEKPPRKARKKRVQSAEKVVSRLLHQARDEATGVESFPPVQIVGSSEVWVYNSRYRFLAVYRALDGNGLSVRGTTVTNYDPDSSEAKAIGRKAAFHLENLRNSTRVQLRKFMDTVPSKAFRPNGRINENTVLVRRV